MFLLNCYSFFGGGLGGDVVPCCMQDLSSLIGDGTFPTAFNAQSLSHGTTVAKKGSPFLLN